MTVTWPPGGLNLIAFARRFVRTWCTLSGSAQTGEHAARSGGHADPALVRDVAEAVDGVGDQVGDRAALAG